jgi:hypothetical protein
VKSSISTSRPSLNAKKNKQNIDMIRPRLYEMTIGLKSGKA